MSRAVRTTTSPAMPANVAGRFTVWRRALFGLFAAAVVLASCGGTHNNTHHSSAAVAASVTPGRMVGALPFPRLAPGARCTRTPGGHATHTTIITLGHGPVYPIMGFSVAPPAAGGVIDYEGEGPAERHPGGLWGNKVLFAVPTPPYAGAITVEGKQIDGPRRVDWLIENDHVVRKLELPEGGHWYATEALLKGAGCYALRIDGSSFSRIIVFRAVNSRTFRQLTARRRR